ncbi:MAG: 1,4-dihydroxy-2-naphthoate octaprenyltransferase [Thermomicrobiales bacterium]
MSSSNPARRQQLLELGLTVAAPLVLLGIWEFLSRSGAIDSRFWPAPSSLWDIAIELFQEDDLGGDIRISVTRILLGMVLGSIPGIALGLAMGLFWQVRAMLMPIATAIYAVPKIAILPLVIIAFGLGESTNLVIIALSIVFLVALSTMSGVLEIDRSLQDVARNFGANRWQLFTTVAFPGALPAIFSGLRLALGFALVVNIGTEFVIGREGLGQMIWSSYQTLQIRQMYVGLVITGLLGWILTLALTGIETFAMPWRHADRRALDVRVWMRAVRLRSFTASTVPIVAATMLARVEGSISWTMVVLMLLASVFTHAACNLTNDYFDDLRGVDSGSTLGQGGALQRNELSHADLRAGIAVSFTAAFIFALPVIREAGDVVIWIGIFSAAAAFLYTAGPFPLAYWALGEVTVFLTMGIGMVCGAFYVLTGELTAEAILLAIAMGLLAAAFLHANNVRDMESDRARNKRTLANLLGRRAATIEVAVLLSLPLLCVLLMILLQPRLFPLAIVAAAIPQGIWVWRRIQSETSPAVLNLAVRKAAGLHFRFGLLASLGLLLAVMFS